MMPFAELAQIIFEGFRDVPDGQMSRALRDEVLEFYDKKPPPSLPEMYDYLEKIAHRSCCQTSSFVKVMCNVSRYYERPCA